MLALNFVINYKIHRTILTKNIKYSEYIAENVAAVNAEPINESVNESAVNEYGKMKEGYTPTMEEVSKCMGEGMKYEAICEMYPDADKGAIKEMCDKCMHEEKKSYKDTISEKLESLISKAEAKNVSEMHFMNFLGESKKNEFNSCSDCPGTFTMRCICFNSFISTDSTKEVRFS